MMIKQTLLYSLNIKNLKSKDSTLDEWVRKWKMKILIVRFFLCKMKVANTHD